MAGTGAPGTEDPAGQDDGLERQLPENNVEYLLFLVDEQIDVRNHLAGLEIVRKAAVQLSHTFTVDYIWQRDEFNLALKNETGLAYLHGVTDHGDAVEDEWLIVHMLREITRSNHRLWARVFDADGEFLLVEAANVLPRWLSPETDHNRVWIHDGKLLIIPPGDNQSKAHQPRALSLPEAVSFVKNKRSELVHSTIVESEAFYRLEKYPGQVTASLHYSLVTIPRKLAFILHSLPKSVSTAVEAFYLRDPAGLRPIVSGSTNLIFPPEDLVTTSVRFSKVLFAQLRSQPFEAPPRWRDTLRRAGEKEPSPEEAQKATARLETGIKLTCGYEMLAIKAEKNKNRVVREVAIMLEDLQEDGVEALPTKEQMDQWRDVRRDDDEAWMDINYDDFERELEGKRPSDSQAKSGFGDAKTQADLRKIVTRFEAFLNDDDAGPEGAEMDDMDIDDDDDDDDEDTEDEDDSDFEDKEVSFDEEEFSKMMREMMGLPSTGPPQPAASKGKGVATLVPDKSATFSEEDAQIQELSSQMEAELKGHGALKLDAPTEKRSRLKDTSKKAEGRATGSADEDDEDTEDEGADEVDIDYNLAKNLLESFKSQAGMAGPTGNLLGMMGFQLPRDEDDGEDDSHGTESQSRKTDKQLY